MIAGSALLGFAAAAVMAALFTRGWVAVANRLGFVDPPNPLIPLHRQPTANIGGLAVAGGALVSVGAVMLAVRTEADDAELGGLGLLLAGGLGFLLLGAIDDVLRLSARAKFAAQIGLALVVCTAGLIHPFTGLVGIDVMLSMLVILVLVNAVNLTDVSDGLVAGLACIALSAVGVTLTDAGSALQIGAAAAAGACFGFLLDNAPPARVFLGDAGSHWIGYTLSALVLLAPPHEMVVARTGVAALVAGIFLFELLLLMASRLRRGVPVWRGSRDHFALRLQAAGWSARSTMLAAWAAGTLLALIGAALHRAETSALGVATAFLVLVVAPALAIAGRSTAEPGGSAASPSGPRRVLWIHQNFVTARQAGNSRPVHIVAALLEAGWAVDIVTTQSGYLEDGGPGDAPRCVVQREGGLTLHRLRTGRGVRHRALSWLSFGGAALIYVGQLRRVDVVFASTPPLPQILIAMVAATVRRAPMVLEVRDLWPLFLERLGLVRSPAAVAVLRWIEAAAYRAARHVVSVSPGFDQYLATMGVAPDASLVAPTGGVDRADDGSAAAASSALRVVYAGSFNEAYDIGRLLRAAEETRAVVPPIQWIFAGAGRSSEAVARASERLENVVYAGALPKDELRPLLETCHLGIVSLVDDPVIHRVIPGKLFDYWSAGLPVLCIAGGMPAAIVRAAEGGEVLSNPNATQVARAVEAYAGADPNRRLTMGSRGRSWMRTHMLAARSARGVAAIVGRVHGTHGGQPQGGLVAWALIAACLDVLRGRSRRALAHLVDDDAEAACAAALLRWTQAHSCGSDPAPLRVPELLAARSASAEPVRPAS